MIEGIILAAGYSRRTETNKMLFVHEGKPLILHAIEGMLPHVDHIYVITGHNRELLEPLIKNYENVTVVYNHQYSKGMLSSAIAGVSLTTGDFLILPGDCPFVKKETYQKILATDDQVCVPSYQGRKGHPIFISSTLKQKLLGEPFSSNLKLFRDKHQYSVVSTNDPNILIDIDTVKDYQNLR